MPSYLTGSFGNLVIALMAIFIFLIVAFELYRPKATRVDFLSAFSALFVLYYPLIIIFYVTSFDDIVKANPSVAVQQFAKFDLEVVAAVIVGYVMTVIGFYSRGALRLANKIQIVPRARVTTDAWTAFGFFIFAFLCTVLYTLQFGGPVEALSQASVIRSGHIQAGPLAFLRKLLPTAQVATLLCFAFLVEKRWQDEDRPDSHLIRNAVIALLILSFSLLIYIQLLRSSRGAIIIFFLIVYTSLVVRKGSLMPILLLIVGGAASFFLMIGDDLFLSFRALQDGGGLQDVWIALTGPSEPDMVTEETPLLLGYFQQFQHLIPSLFGSLTVVPAQPDELRWFADWIYGVLSLLPESLIPIETPASVTVYNTYVLLGLWESTIPPGLLAFGVYSMWWPGLVIYCLAIGWAGRFIQTVLLPSRVNCFWRYVMYAQFIFVWAMGLVDGDPRLTVRSYFVYVGWLLLAMVILNRVTIRKPASISIPNIAQSRPKTSSGR